MGPLEAIVFLTRLAISGRVVVFLHAFITSGRPGGRAREGWQNYFWTRLRASGRAGGQLAKLFLDASCYFWTRRGISARVHNERAAGRAGGRGKDGKTISGHVFGRAGRLPKLFLDTSSAKLFLGTSPGGRPTADKLPKLFLDTSSAKLFLGTSPGGRAGGRTGWQSYFWTRLAISGRVVVFLHAFITNGRPGGRAGEGKDGKTISGHVFGRAGGRTGCQSYFWTRLPPNYFWARLRAGGRAGEERLPKWLRFAWQAQDFGSFLFEKLKRPCTKCSFGSLLLEKLRKPRLKRSRNARFGTLLLEKLRRPRTKCSFWKLVAWKVEEASHKTLVLEACCVKS